MLRGALSCGLALGLLLCAITIIHAQEVITNEAQIVEVLDQPGFVYPLASPFEPKVFTPMDVWYFDFSQVTNALVAVKDYPGQGGCGITSWPLRLTRDVGSGDIVVQYGTNDIELLRLVASPNSEQYERVLSYWARLTAKDSTSFSELVAEGCTFLDPPRTVADVWAFDINDWPTCESNMLADAEAGEPSMETGGHMMLDDVSCTITDEASPFVVLSVGRDTNGWTTVTWESCSDHIYGVLSTDLLGPSTVYTGRAAVWGLDGSTSWTDTTTTNVDKRFYKVVRMPPDGDFDNDGLSNEFEVQYGLDPFNPADAASDPDGDGYSNWDEALMGTSPIATNDLVTVYVDSMNTNGVWDGTQAHPFRYIQDAMQCSVSVNSNLAIRVRPGIYYETVSNLHLNFSGGLLSKRKLVFIYAATTNWALATDPETHVIDSSGLPHNDVLGNGSFGPWPAVQFWDVTRARLDGFTVQGGKGVNAGGIECISTQGVVTVSNCIVEKNGNLSSCLAGGILVVTLPGSLVYNTVMTKNSGTEAGGLDDYSGVRVWNCTVVNNGSGVVGGIYGLDTSDSIVRNCAIWGNALDVAYANVDYSTFGSNEVVVSGGHNLTVDPSLVNIALGNYRLQSTSVVLSAGTVLPMERRDLYGNGRPLYANFDIGANQLKDTDSDGIQDDWESKHGLNLSSAGDASGNPDGDGFNNLEEYNHNTDPQKSDTDGDGINDNLDSDPTTPELVVTAEWHDPLHQSVWKYWINGTNDPAWINQPASQPRVLKLNNYHVGDRVAIQLSYQSGATNTIYFLVPLQSTGAFSVVPDANATPLLQLTSSAPIGQRTPPDPGWMTTIWQSAPTNADVCAGFDDETPKFFNFTHRALSVPQNGTNTFSMEIAPVGVTTQVIFTAADSFITISPSSASSPTQLVQVAGSTSGTNIQASTFIAWGVGAQHSSTNASAIVDVDVLPKGTNVTVALYRITATTSNFPPSNVPTAVELSNYLATVFGKQANVFMNVLAVTNVTVNYDFSPSNGGLDFPAAGLSLEQIAITSAVSRANAINVYFVNTLINTQLIVGISYRSNLKAIFIQEAHTATNVNVAAHEIGHELGLDHPDDKTPVTGDPDRLMWSTGPSNPCRLIRREWQTVNGNAQ